MATLTTQNIDTDGLVPTYAAASGGGDKMLPGEHDFLHVKNGGGSSITVTLVTPSTVDSTLAVGDRAITVTNGTDQMIRVPSDLYRDPADGLASITYSGVTTVTVAAIRA